jgi:S1-C subfamily serine protease
MRRFSGYGPSIVVLVTAAIVLFAGPAAVRRLTYEQTRTRIIEASDRLASGDMLSQINQATRDIASMVEPSVVHVSAQYFERDALGSTGRIGLSTGSGWVYDELGHVVTNHHVVQNASRIEVQLYNGELREATLVGSDPTTDIAVIKITPERLHPAVLADMADAVNQGDMVFAFGSPFDFRFSMSSGVVSGKGRSVGVIRDEFNNRIGYENFIQVDAAINPGNSGGPLTDYRGRVIGMNTAIATGRSRGSPSLEEGQFAGIGLAIPIDMIVPAVSQIIERGYVEKSYIGVGPEELNSELSRRLAYFRSGVIMSRVHRDGPAFAAGVQPLDIVSAVNGRDVASVQQLRSIVSSMRPGETARLTIWRFDQASSTGQQMDIDVPLQRLDSLRAEGRVDPKQQRRDSLAPLGILKMATATREAAHDAGVEFRPGVVIIEPTVRLARKAPPGSVIVSVMDQSVRNVDELMEVLSEFSLLQPPGAIANIVTPQGEFTTLPLFVAD